MALSQVLYMILIPTLALASRLDPQAVLGDSTSSTSPSAIISSSKLDTPLLNLHRNLCTITSTSGLEHDVGNWLVGYLDSHGFTVEEQWVAPLAETVKPRFNIYAYLGHNRTTRTLLTSHIDTVPPHIPYSLKNEDAKDTGDIEIWGRGTSDAKGSVAAQITAVLELRDESPELLNIEPGVDAQTAQGGELGLLFVVGEEIGGDGMKVANELDIAWDNVIFGEPTEGKLACGHKGLTSMKVHVHGHAAHSGYPWLGASATSALVRGLNAIIEMQFPWSKKYGESTINIGKVTGGVANNVMAVNASADVSVRLAGGHPDEIHLLMADAFDRAAGAELGPHGYVDYEFYKEAYPPVDCDCDVEGLDKITVNYGTDVPHLKGSHKRYLYGPGSILVAHGDDEHVRVKELEQAVKDYKKIVRQTLKK